MNTNQTTLVFPIALGKTKKVNKIDFSTHEIFVQIFVEVADFEEHNKKEIGGLYSESIMSYLKAEGFIEEADWGLNIAFFILN